MLESIKTANKKILSVGTKIDIPIVDNFKLSIFTRTFSCQYVSFVL